MPEAEARAYLAWNALRQEGEDERERSPLSHDPAVEDELRKVIRRARLSRTGALEEELQRLPTADLDIFGLAGDPNFDFQRQMLRQTHSSCLFVRDSDQENVLA